MIVRELVTKLGFDSRQAVSAAKRWDRTVDSMKSKMVDFSKATVVAAGAAAFSMSKIADEYVGLESRMKLVTKGAEDLKTAQDGIFASAQETGTAYKASTDLFIRLSRSTRRFGYDQEKILKVTNAIQKAMVISGDANSPGAQAALFQLGQGLQSGTLRGEELNSVLEQAPRLAEAIAAGMNIKPEDFKKQAEAGAFTTQKIFEAILSQSIALDEEFSIIGKRASMSWQRVKNSFERMVFSVAKGEGTMDGLVDVFEELKKVIESKEFRDAFIVFVKGFTMLLKGIVLVIKGLASLITKIKQLMDSMKENAWIFRLIASALIPLLLFLGSRALITFGILNAGLTMAAGLFGSLITVIGWVGRAVLLMLGPWGLLAAAIILAIDDVWAFYQGNESVIGKLMDAWEDYVWWFTNLWEKLPAWFRAPFEGRGGVGSAGPSGPKAASAPATDMAASGFKTGQVIQLNATTSITVPPGTTEEQTKYLNEQIAKTFDEKLGEHLRYTLNDYPETE